MKISRNCHLHVATLASCAVLIGTSTSFADPLDLYVVDVPVVDSPDDPADLTNVRCLDLYVRVQPGDTITSAELLSMPDGLGFSSQAPLFKHPLGADTVRDETFAEFFPDILYDTALALGDLGGDINAQFFDLSDPSDITGLWFATGGSAANPGFGPGSGAFTPNFPNFSIYSNSVWLARFSIVTQSPFPIPHNCITGLNGELRITGKRASGETFVTTLLIGQCLSGDFKPPSDFNQTAPVSVSTNVNPNNTTLTWTESLPAEKYLSIEYRVRITSDFRHWNEIHRADGIVDTSYTIPPETLTPCTTYYWDAHADSTTAIRAALNWRDGAFTTLYPGDMNADGTVDTADLGQLLDAFMTTEPVADLNGDGVVDTADLGILLANFGQTCD